MASKQNLSIIVDLQDKASSKLKGFENRIEKMQPAFKKMAVAGAVAFTGITVAIGKSIKAFQGQERAEKRLETLTKNTTNATEDQIDALKDQASALQQLGVVGDEITLVGQSQLATFALTTDAIAELTPAMLDMAVATKGVNATQEDMINIGNALGRALEGGAGALTRYGISLTDAQKEQFDMANKMERASLLAEILGDNFGGLNEAMAETSEGQMQQLKNSFGDLQETIGEIFIPILAKAVEKIKPVVENVQNWIENNKQLFETITLVSLGLAGVVTSVGTLGIALGTLLRGMRLIVGIFTILNTKMLLIVGTMGLVAYTVFRLWADWNLAFTEMKITFMRMADDVAGAFEWMINGIITGINAAIWALNKLISALEKVPGAKSVGVSQIDKLDDFKFERRNVDYDAMRIEALNASNQKIADAKAGAQIYISGNTFLDEESAEKVGDLLMGQTKLNTSI